MREQVEREAAGLVACDDSDCTVKEDEVSEAAIVHWREHSLMSGCSHGC